MTRRLAVLMLIAIGLLTAMADARASSDHGGDPPGNGISGKNGSGEIAVGGTRSTSPGETTGTGPSDLISVTCGTGAQRQLYNLGDLAPGLSKQTCSDQTLECEKQAQLQKRKLDPVVTVEKQQDGTWQYAGNTCATNGPAVLTADMVRERAVRLVPSARVGLAPHGSTLVNIETVMWADAQRQTTLAPVTIVGQRVTIRLVLDHVVWTFGDGTTETDGPAGMPYDESRHPCRSRTCERYFGHVYTRTGAVTVQAVASWHASFSVGNAGPVDIPGVVQGPAGRAAITVKQARGVLVLNPGQGR